MTLRDILNSLAEESPENPIESLSVTVYDKITQTYLHVDNVEVSEYGEIVINTA